MMQSTQPNRRTFLKSAGVLLALPYLESLNAATQREEVPPKRMVFICTKLGLYSPSLFPGSDGQLAANTEYLKLLQSHLQDITLFRGLSHANQNGRLSHSSELTWLTGAEHPGLDGFKNSISVDQFAAQQLSYVTRFSSVQLSSEGESSQSYNNNGVMIPAESSPSRVFSQMFLNGTPAEIERQKQRLRFDQSILDGLIDQTRSLMKRATPNDRSRLEAYLDSIRETEKNLAASGAWLERPKPIVSATLPEDVVNKGDIEGRIQLMFDLIPLMLQTDSTRVINMGIQVDHGVIKMDGVKEEHHSLSHHGNDPDKIAKLKRVETSIIRRFSELLTKMKREEQNGSRLLDNTSILFGSNLGNANNHDYRNLPIIVAGGGFEHGHLVAYDRTTNQPLSNLFLTMLRQSGIDADAFGASTGTLDWS